MFCVYQLDTNDEKNGKKEAKELLSDTRENKMALKPITMMWDPKEMKVDTHS